MASISIGRSDDCTLIDRAHRELLGIPAEFGPNDVYWVARDTATGDVIGFCGGHMIPEEKAVSLSSVAVFPAARGQRLQRRLMRVVERWAKRSGATCVITYTLLDNYPSIANIVRSNYNFYEPVWRWAGRDVHYFKKKL